MRRPLAVRGPHAGGASRWRGGVLALLAGSVGGAGVGCDAPKITPTSTARSATARPGVNAASSSFVRWPPLPAAPTDLDALVAAHTTRPPSAVVEWELARSPSVEALQAALIAGGRTGRLVAGTEAVTAWLQRQVDAARAQGKSVYVLWGNYHDAPGQLRAFRRAVGPTGMHGWSLAVVEQLDATGRWWGAELQSGDDNLLGQYLLSGAVGSLDLLLARQRRDNYTAWKYGYLDEMADLLVTARAAGVRVMGGDMPRAMQQRLPFAYHLVNKLRELHCALALREALADVPAPHTVALFWGQNHVFAEGLPRFLPADAHVVSLVLLGERIHAPGLEGELRRSLALSDPVLLTDPSPPANHAPTQQAILLLPGPDLGAGVERVRTTLEAPLGDDEAPALEVASTGSGTLWVAGQEIRIEGGAGRRVLVAAGDHPFVFAADEGGQLAGAVTVPRGGEVSLELEPAERRLRVHTHAPEP